MSDGTRVRSRHSDLIHITVDSVRTLCNRPLKGWLIEPDTAVTCAKCRDAAEFN